MFKRQVYKVPPLVGPARSDPVARWIAFTGAPELVLGQAWRTEREADFSPGAVRVMWDQSGLMVAASLEDEDILNPSEVPNELAFTVGDAFEIFLWPMDAEAYTELHVTPGNVHLALRFPVSDCPREDLDRFKIDPDCFASLVKVDRVASSWTVAADIPWSALGVELRPGMELLASFSRYDYTEGRDQPVLSSTSPHTELDFHRREEWARLILTGG